MGHEKYKKHEEARVRDLGFSCFVAKDRDHLGQELVGGQ
jgi:hypothetical protein